MIYLHRWRFRLYRGWVRIEALLFTPRVCRELTSKFVNTTGLIHFWLTGMKSSKGENSLTRSKFIALRLLKCLRRFLIAVSFLHSKTITAYLCVLLSVNESGFVPHDATINSKHSWSLLTRHAWMRNFFNLLSVYEYLNFFLPNLTRSPTEHNWANLLQSWFYEAL